ncbi:hypothetical protein [Photobacterium andalusiense]|uniref:Uncharacterized protein n=1 Tax=Photobacterium andalusiense TaxID=2204296 RepID=A0A1Y6MPT0_9GAMM|nr:hypothetical protein [Photobacterium andalusiense]SMY38564.1 hypothetical protein PAND9192_03687 [Photobacterium andalusiense]
MAAVKIGDWISVGESGMSARVFNVFSDNEVAAGYLQNNVKAVKDDFTWDGHIWRFKYKQPSGFVLGPYEASLVKMGPFINTHK